MTSGRGAALRHGRLGAVAAGLAIAALYVIAALVTPHLTGRAVRPLFDGFAPPAPYKWVNPPAEFAKDNKKPSEANQQVTLGPDGSVASNTTTDDGQAIAGLDTGSIPVHFPDSSVRAQVTPLDPGTLGPLPSGLRPEGNAYRVTFTYEPSGQVVTSLAKPGTIALTGAGPVSALLYSSDGKTWQDTGGRPFGDSNGLFSQLTGPGYFVAASHNPPRTGVKKGGSGGALVGVGIAAVVVVVAVVVGVLLSRRRGSGGSPPKSGRGNGNGRGGGGRSGGGGRPSRPPSSGPGSGPRRRPGS